MPPSKSHIETVLGRQLTDEQFALVAAVDSSADPSEFLLPPHRRGEQSRRRVRDALETFMAHEDVHSPMVYAIRQHLAGQG